MAKSAAETLNRNDRALDWARDAAMVVAASLFVALCAHVTLPLPFTPVPLTLGNFAVLLVGLMLGSRRGFAALALYLAEGAMGMPVFSPTGPGGVAQLLGPTGGYLIAYPLVAGLAGWIMERGTEKLCPRRHRRRVGGDSAFYERHCLARNSLSLIHPGGALRPLLVCFCRSDQGHVGCRHGARLAAH